MEIDSKVDSHKALKVEVEWQQNTTGQKLQANGIMIK